MNKIKEKNHFRLVNTITIWPLTKFGMNETVVDIVEWFLEKNNIEGVTLDIELKETMSCWGDSEQVIGEFGKHGDVSYDIRICVNQSLRDFVATLMHELVHVQQWHENTWDGDGEKEATSLEYKLADEYWNKTTRI